MFFNTVLNNEYKSSIDFQNNNKIKELYIYRISKDSLLSKPTTIEHKNYRRSGFTLGIYESYFFVGANPPIESPNDTLKYNISTKFMKIGKYFSDNIEAGISFPVEKRERVTVDNVVFLYPEMFSTYAYYHVTPGVDYISMCFGPNINLYEYEGFDNRNNKKIGATMQFSASVRIIATNYIDFKIFMGGKFHAFQQEIFKEKSGGVSVDFGLQFEL